MSLEGDINRHLDWEAKCDKIAQETFSNLDLICKECGHMFLCIDDFLYDGDGEWLAYCPECEMKVRVV